MRGALTGGITRLKLFTAIAAVVLGCSKGAAASQGAYPVVNVLPANATEYLDRHGARLGWRARNIYYIGSEGFEAIDVLASGVWEPTNDGGRVLHLGVSSSGAAAQVLVLRGAALPPRARVTVYAPGEADGPPERRTCVGSCREAAIGGSQTITTPGIAGSLALVEYYEPPAHLQVWHPDLDGWLADEEAGGNWEEDAVDESVARVQPQAHQLRIIAVMQGLGGGLAPGAAPLAVPPTRRRLQQDAQTPVLGTTFNVPLIQQTTDTCSTCTPNVACMPQWANESSGVITIYAVNLKLQAVGLCSGALVHAPRDDKLVLTADHCFLDKKDLRDFQFWLLIFNYVAPCGSLNAPPITQVIQGVRMLYYNSDADVLLLAVPGAIPDSFHAFKLGYDAGPEAVPTSVVGIHSPGGNFKHISFANATDAIKTKFVAQKFPPGEVQPTDATHFKVTWTQGVTQGGSSGSPLIDVGTRRIVGVLTGGFSSCIGTITTGDDYYGRLSVAWWNGLELYLSWGPAAGLERLQLFQNVSHNSVDQTWTDNLQALQLNQHVSNGVFRNARGPRLSYLPNVLRFHASQRTATVLFYLTDAPRAGTTATADVYVRGDLLGNALDAAEFVTLSATRFTFNATHYNRPERFLQVNVSGVWGDIPDGLLRFEVVFNMSSDDGSLGANSGTLQSVKGIIQEEDDWTELPAVPCPHLPCVDSGSNASAVQRAVWRFAPAPARASSQVVGLVLCLEPGALEDATVSAYADGVFVWTISRDPYDSPDCLHIPGLQPTAGKVYHTTVSDLDDLNAILPLRVVTRLYLDTYTAINLSDIASIMPGPVEGQPSPVLTKSANFSINTSNITRPGVQLAV